MASIRHTLRILMTLLASGVLAAAVAGPAAAGTFKADPDAPAGASADWLPHEEWVGQRWMPFDEVVLERKLGMRSDQVWTYLSSTGNSLEVLARSRHVSTKGLATRLLSTRHLSRKSRLFRTLRSRTQRVLDQPHLAAHMFGHVFHIWSITSRTAQVLGVTSAQFQQLYGRQHLSFLQVAVAGGVDEATLRHRALAAANRAGAVGVAKRAMSARQNRVLRARDAAEFPSWANYRLAYQTTPLTRGLVCHLPAA
jgi:hypothetical protein